MDDWAALRHEYQAKNEVFLSRGWEYTDALDFYREVFPPGFLEEAGVMVDWDEPGGGRPNAIALEVRGTEEGKDGRQRNVVRRHTLTDGLPELEAIRAGSAEANSFCFMSPISYFGKARTAANARFLHAIAVDLDGVGTTELARVLAWTNGRYGWVPCNYIVNSGTGLHLYWVLEAPVPLVPGNVPGLQLLKRRLTEKVWTEDTSEREAIQYQGIYQGFRMPNTSTKLNGAPGSPKLASPYEAVCWRNPEAGPRTALDELVRSVPDIGKANNQYRELLEVMETAGRTPLAVARRKWPEWYERRVVEGCERGSYVVDRHLYDWWLRRVRSGYSVGHRYWCVFALASFANKCGIDQAELEADAFSLVGAFRRVDTPDNPFTEEDVLSALDAFEDGRGDGRSRRYTRAFLERKTAIPMPAKKRNGLTRSENLEVARMVRDIRQRRDGTHWYDNAGRPKGSPNKSHPKRDAIIAYAESHPEANHSEIARALGVSRPTVIKWLKECGKG